ncbi:MAG: signal peptide peptidase SppA, partial [Planctomycetota bacterium]
AKRALRAGLVDDLTPWIGARQALAKVLQDDSLAFVDVLKKTRKRKSVNVFQLMSTLLNPKKDTAAMHDLVVLHLSGPIMDGTQESQGMIISGPTVKLIRKLTKNAKVKAVVVRINSPGGSATASEAILLALQELAQKKPLAVSMGDVAASGGYYISCLGRPIFAENGTITGSIGVFGLKPSLGKLMRRIGLKEELVALDDGPSMSSLEQPWTDQQKATVQGLVDDVYGRFVGHVSRSRKLARDAVLKSAGGRVWSGQQAVANKLVDRIGGLGDALAMVAKEAGVKPDGDVTHLPRPKDPLVALAEQLMEVRAILPDAAVRLLARRSRSLDRGLQILLDAVQSEHPTHVWAVLPEALHVR